MTDVIQTIEADAVAMWQKVEAVLSADEQAVFALLKPLLGQASAAAVADLKVFVTAVLTQVAKGQDLATLESVVMNALQVAKSSLLGTAQQLGSDALQALIGLLLAQLN